MQLLVLLSLFGLAFSAREEDKVEFLPGLEIQPEFNHYAGYLKATEGNHFFYWFVESENDPDNDPVVLWLNGGPGCSSMTGFLVELGPWRVLPDGSGLEWFEQRWNKIANIIFLESPQCVGYSYNDQNNCTTGDDQVALDNHMALLDFFEGFPEYSENEFFVTGESYAGIYVPTLTRRLLDDDSFNLKGMAIGNGVTDWGLMDNALVPYIWARGIYGTEDWMLAVDACCENMNATNCRFGEVTTAECLAEINKMNEKVWSTGLNPYNYLQECDGGAPYAEDDDFITMVPPGEMHLAGKANRQDYRKYFHEMTQRKKVKASIPCTDTSDRDIYLNNPEVREALHVAPQAGVWEACNSEVGRNYKYEYDTMREEYLQVITANKHVLVFNGDLDMACNHLGDMWFVEQLEQEQLLNGEYNEWFVGEGMAKQIAGWTLQYENLVYNQVLGAGHFVPTDKPVAAYAVWEKFLRDETYP